MNQPANQLATEGEDEGAITGCGIILRDPKKSSVYALTTYVTQTIVYYENHSEEGHDL
jgi:hypothetical protein